MSWFGDITLAHFIVLGAILFCIAVAGIFVNRKNVIVLLMCIELMLLAVNTNFVAFSRFLGDVSGQVFVFLHPDRRGRGIGDRTGDSRRAVPQSRDDQRRRNRRFERLTRCRHSGECRNPATLIVADGKEKLTLDPGFRRDDEQERIWL